MSSTSLHVEMRADTTPVYTHALDMSHRRELTTTRTSIVHMYIYVDTEVASYYEISHEGM